MTTNHGLRGVNSHCLKMLDQNPVPMNQNYHVDLDLIENLKWGLDESQKIIERGLISECDEEDYRTMSIKKSRTSQPHSSAAQVRATEVE
jgi:hypothetical protein